MSENEQNIRKIAEARFRARKKWLEEHQGAGYTNYGHAHGMMGNLEAGISEGYGGENELKKGERILLEKYGVDVSKLPE